MNSQTVTKEISNLYDLYNVTGKERNAIDAICNNMVKNDDFILEVEVAVKMVLSGNFKIEEKVPSLISALLRITNKIEYYKSVDESRMKCILYYVLVASLLKFHPKVLTEQIEIEKFRTLYFDCIELVLMIPETVKIARKSCLTCIGSSVKLFSRFNKDKILI